MGQKLSVQRTVWLLRALGGLGLLIGVAALWIAPQEVQVFYLFLPSGRFAYEGYNWGTFMFAFIAIQVAGYYGLGLLGIVLGWGHLRLRGWMRPLVRGLLWAWLVAGAPLTALGYLLLFISKGMTPVGLLVSLPFALVLYPLLPWVLYRWYGCSAVEQAFAHTEPSASAWSTLPPRVGGTIALLLLYALALQLPLLVNGLFPWFGTLWSGKTGLYANGPLTILFGGLLWALVARRGWAWWLALATLGGWTASLALTFARYTLADILALMQLPPTELGFLEHMPFLHQPAGLVACLPPLVLIVLLLAVRRRYILWARAGATVATGPQ
jgi:hypothetical protein